jgi:hypothetical protein
MLPDVALLGHARRSGDVVSSSGTTACSAQYLLPRLTASDQIVTTLLPISGIWKAGTRHS